MATHTVWLENLIFVFSFLAGMFKYPSNQRVIESYSKLKHEAQQIGKKSVSAAVMKMLQNAGIIRTERSLQDYGSKTNKELR